MGNFEFGDSIPSQTTDSAAASAARLSQEAFEYPTNTQQPEQTPDAAPTAPDTEQPPELPQTPPPDQTQPMVPPEQTGVYEPNKPPELTHEFDPNEKPNLPDENGNGESDTDSTPPTGLPEGFPNLEIEDPSSSGTGAKRSEP